MNVDHMTALRQLSLFVMLCIASRSAAALPPVEVPKPDDRIFVFEQDKQLSAGEIWTTPDAIQVTRYAGPTDGTGHLLDAAALTADELADQSAWLEIIARGVQTGSHHQVFLNDTFRGFLKPSPTCEWSKTVLNIPLTDVRFPGARGSGGPPVARLNPVKIVVDGNPDCLRFRAASLSVKLMSPIILIHGNNQEGSFFVDRGFTSGLDAKHLVWDSSIQMATNSRADHGVRLSELLGPIVASSGVDSVHLVAHSKGGLDAREYLQVHYPSKKCVGGSTPGAECSTDSPCQGDGAACKRPFDVLTLTTLSTPHNGSVLADVSQANGTAATMAMAVEFVGFPSFTGLLANLAGADTPLEIRAEFDLKTTTCGAFNASNIGALPGDTRYHAVAADADSNGNAAVDSSPDEYAELRAESLELEAMHNEVGAFASRRIVDKMYQILRNTASVTIRVSSRPVGTMEVMSVAEVIGVPNPSPLGNDTFVTLPSGLGTGTYSTLTTNSLPLVGAQARNHASVANSGVATSIWTWLRGVEEQTGDLR